MGLDAVDQGQGRAGENKQEGVKDQNRNNSTGFHKQKIKCVKNVYCHTKVRHQTEDGASVMWQMVVRSKELRL